MGTELPLSEMLMHSTVRIHTKTHKKDGTEIGVGTGFFFNFTSDENTYVPVIITNKHVIEGTDEGFLVFTLKDEDGNRLSDQHHELKITNFEKRWMKHPQKEVDLCIMPIGPILNQAKEFGIEPFFMEQSG